MTDLNSRALRLAQRFEQIANTSDDANGPEDLRAASAEGGLILKKWHGAGAEFLGDHNAAHLRELFSQDEDVRDPAQAEFVHSTWFVFLIDRLSEQGNPLGLKLVRRFESGQAMQTTGNWRLRARNFAAFCHELATLIEPAKQTPVGMTYQDRTWASCFEVTDRTIRNWRERDGFPSSPCTLDSVQAWAKQNGKTMHKIPN